jgi:hypothetical protein
MEAMEQKREQLANLCRQYHVQRLALFGSALRDDFDSARSDLDFVVEFKPLPAGTYADTYFGLMEALEQLFQRPGRSRRRIGYQESLLPRER